MNTEDIARLSRKVDFGNIADPANALVLGTLTREQREEFALKTKSMVLYLGEEVAACRLAEERAALRAAPRGCELRELNGPNIGCGDRPVSPYLTQVDIMRGLPPSQSGGEHNAFLPEAILALPDDLPFRPGSVDYIISPHMLEHIQNPAQVVQHWLTLIRPGGGVGVVVPDWHYTWDARHDNMPYGHKWNPEPNLILKMFHEHWSSDCSLEEICTYDFRLSFDFVLRKPGAFEPFSLAKSSEKNLTGAYLWTTGKFLA